MYLLLSSNVLSTFVQVSFSFPNLQEDSTYIINSSQTFRWEEHNWTIKRKKSWCFLVFWSSSGGGGRGGILVWIRSSRVQVWAIYTISPRLIVSFTLYRRRPNYSRWTRWPEILGHLNWKYWLVDMSQRYK